jgi:hypothetical protein
MLPPGARCTTTRTARCRGRAAGSPTCTSFWRMPSWTMTTRSTSGPAQMEDPAREGRYPSGSYLPALSHGFAAFKRGDFSAAIEALAPLAGESERIGGSRAQHDLIACSARGDRVLPAVPSRGSRWCTDRRNDADLDRSRDKRWHAIHRTCMNAASYRIGPGSCYHDR